ncbi:energy transducer TonB [Teredinibacter sp. KSP-S5-2]|uniref:energy transducer TonB n=1 Tax=Teredinibacter sp. KSP-S5-2 TaxID=3034506 RepID=UPI002934BA5B|nr:energy transducer TonB [Teredinibacter sp. KSP-S5-2]WNO10335.1 energy transducer TonB [Teredinibacter sp. KSP-S5-2]
MEKEKTLVIREVDVSRLPPPPPPPEEKVVDDSSDSVMEMSLIGDSAGVELTFSKTPSMKTIQLEKIEYDDLPIEQDKWEDLLAVDFPEVEMSELDEMPTIISRKSVSIPWELRRRGISRVATQVKVLIDEGGNTFLLKILDSKYPEMEVAIRELVKSAKFTPPKKNGEAVHARYDWPITFIQN